METIAKSRPAQRNEPHDFCKLTPDQITLMIGDRFWYSVQFTPRTINSLREFIPAGAPIKPYIDRSDHGWYIELSVKQAYELSDRMTAEAGGHSQWMRERGFYP